MAFTTLVLMLVTVRTAVAHGVSFGVSQVSIAPDDPGVVWAVVDGWGLVWTEDAGARWSWACEEAIGEFPVLSVLARPRDDAGRSRAWVGTRGGLLVVDDDCGATHVPGLPEGAYVAAIAADPHDPAGVLVLATGARGGVYACRDAACVATGLVGEGLYPKSIVVDDAGSVWVTTVAAETLDATLWRAEAPTGARAFDVLATWEARARWPDGDVDPRVLDVRGTRVLLWERTRAAGDTPRLVRSGDGGVSWAPVLAHGTWTDAPPGLVRVGDTVLLGSAVGARTWRSRNDGRSWTDVSLDLPSVRCGVVGQAPAERNDASRVVWTCGDHLADGFDLATSTDLEAWSPVACLQDAAVAACASGTCDAVAGLYGESGALGGDACSPDTGLDLGGRSACGCAAERESGADVTVLLVGATVVVSRRRRARARTLRGVAPRPEET